MNSQFDINTCCGSKIRLPNGFDFFLPSKRMRAACRFLIGEIFKKKRYSARGFEIKQDDIILDIGANMGLFAMWAAPQVGKGKIIAVEPIAETMEILNDNLKNNNIKSVDTLKAAIGTDGDFVDFVTYPGFNVINHQSAWQPALYTKLLVYSLTTQWKCKKLTERVCAVSLGRIISDYGLDRINILKIDAEGSEYEVFRNLSDENFGRIDKIIMEFHEYYPGNRHEELVSILTSKGFNVRIEKPLCDYYFGKCGFIWAWK